MTDPDHSKHKPAPAPSFWKSRVGATLIVFLAIAAVLLGFEHRLHIFTGNGLIVTFLLGSIVMHFFMHGGHGGGGHGGKHGGDKS
ncbi:MULTISPECIES: DUF2933 domain-containing protein [Hoeflea]|uniref:DUF2933 domain-containing protein n=1 Tax=Hoeflea algicola TaxID=2983763 RepID=A0ABT3ZG52_9HYPH|nr:MULTISPECIES: DUF2933 domain-containing protein [Hoeflea]KGF67223.1 hypothetical protein LL06_23575 [Hoeflea sp. BAL378]MCY0150787.1 DUF2933 domain-containing protein [Hoeflea algicola]|tara:strand:+ start:23899 stop:24153 length:255 start_codon:yes stop_codon:yes gene_type:complete